MPPKEIIDYFFLLLHIQISSVVSLKMFPLVFKNCCINTWHLVFVPLYHLFQIRAISLFVCLANGRLREASVIAFTIPSFLEMWVHFYMMLLSLFIPCLSTH